MRQSNGTGTSILSLSNFDCCFAIVANKKDTSRAIIYMPRQGFALALRSLLRVPSPPRLKPIKLIMRKNVLTLYTDNLLYGPLKIKGHFCVRKIKNFPFKMHGSFSFFVTIWKFHSFFVSGLQKTFSQGIFRHQITFYVYNA